MEDRKSAQHTLSYNQELTTASGDFVHRLIEANAQEHPEWQAICSHDGSLTYAELDFLSSRLAGYLAVQAVGPEVVVPLWFEKSAWTIVAMLAVLRAGGAFVAVDVSQPTARLESIIRQTGAVFALSSTACFDKCSVLVERVFAVNMATVSALDEPGQLCTSLKPNNLAYIIFTSGSTGTPKGVLLEHSQLSTFCHHSGELLGYGARQRVLQFSSYVFDAYIMEVFATLYHGGTVCVPLEWERKNALVEAMRRMEVTQFFLTPSVLSSIVIKNVPTLKTIVLGGESVPSFLVEEWASKLRLILLYGPTECCIGCLTVEASRHKPAPTEIGLPFTARTWIVKEDDYNELVDIGETGELLIEGPLLARGYLNDTVKTDSQFVRNPEWAAGEPIRLYRTGDLARHLPDGRVCYAGRIDSQVKIRGQRLELTEVESHLRGCLTTFEDVKVEQVIVTAATPFRSVSAQLVAFLQVSTPSPIGYLQLDAEDGPAPQTSSVEREYFTKIVSRIEKMLRSLVPSYAVPSIYIPLREVPHNLSGKMDRERLKSTVSRYSVKELKAYSNAEHIALPVDAPPTEDELRFQGLWATVFGTSPSNIQPTSDFFSLGGESVLAMKLVSRARAAGLDLTLETVFKQPLLCDMARITEHLEAPVRELVPIPPFSLLNVYGDVGEIHQQASRQCSTTTEQIEDIYPCTPTQSGLLALSLKDPGAYVMQQVYELPSSVDIYRFMAAWDAVAARTEVLRTKFFNYRADFLQAVVTEPLEWQVVNGDLARLLALEKKRSISFGGPMMWFTVLRQRAPQPKVYFVWTVHHSLVDAWSASVIAASVEQEYRGQPAQSSVGGSFKSFIKHVHQQDSVSAQSFWRRQLANAPASTFPSLPHPTYIPHASRVLQHEIASFKRASVTASTIIQAAWALLIGIYTNSSDIVLGVTLNGRTAPVPGIDLVPGPTLTTVPFRVSLKRDQTLEKLLQDIQEQYFSILQFEQYGMQKIQHLDESARAACNFQSLLVVQAALGAKDAGTRLLELSSSSLSVDCVLMLECDLHESRNVLRATFDDQVLSAAQVLRMLRQLEHLVHRLSTDSPSTEICELQTISDDDVAQIQEWNSMSDVPPIAHSTVHELIRQIVIDSPSAVAISAWDGETSYKTLDGYSSRLASYLQSQYGIQTGSLVAICFEKSMWTVVSMLAVLKAGGACVPMDPKSPPARLRTLLSGLGEDSSNLVITSPLHARGLGRLGTRVLAVGPRLISTLDESRTLLGETSSPADLAFVVFTSGSTGAPKGVMLEHRTFCSSALAHGFFTRLSRGSRVLQFAAHTFDISIGDIFATLIHGGCVCIPSEHDRLNDLGGAIRSLKVNHVSLTTTVASHLRPEEVTELKTLVVAGEAMSKDIIDTWADQVVLVDMYGPAECTVYCIGKADIKRHDHPSNIGRGVGATIWLVDPEEPNRLAPIGAVGELLIEGPNLARGYLGNVAQTKSAFLEDLAWSKSQHSTTRRRFYRTGDLGSYNADGTIAFIGRNDDQVKIHGQRLEIGEVEHQLRMSLPSTVEVAVSIVTPKDSGKSLGAFLVVGDDSGSADEGLLCTSPTSLEQFRGLMEGLVAQLDNALPSYMVPQIYIPIRSLPLSASGKVERKKLQSEASNHSLEQLSALQGLEARTHKPPSTRMEKRIETLWAELLGTHNIGVDDNFFRLGGDSVLAMQLVSIARTKDLTLTVQDIFQNPSLSSLAATVNEDMKIAKIAPFSLLQGLDVAELCQQATLQCNIHAAQIEDIYPCTFLQRRMILGQKRTASEPRDYQAQLVFSLPASLDLRRFKAAWDLAIRRNSILRTRLINKTSEIFQVVVNETASWAEATSLEEYLHKDRFHNMTFGKALARFAIVQSEDSLERNFVLSIQHAVYDAFSFSLLFGEVEQSYFNGASSPLPPPQMNQYMKYIVEADKDAAVHFWTSCLAGTNTKPLHRPGEPFPNITTRTVVFDMPNVHNSEITLSTMIEVATGLVLAHHIGCVDVILRSVRLGRGGPVARLEELIGPTITVIPLRVRLDKLQKASDLLHTAQALQSEMLQHEHLGFFELKEMNHLAAILQHSYHVNVNPAPTSVLGRGLGMELHQTQMRNADPLGVYADLNGERLELNIRSDDEYVPGAKVEAILADIRRVLLRFAKLGLREVTVGEILGDSK
ncbi:hypothetical protein BJ170DRAFT_586415 [Xylariales sp. AK1849]|nr:hypothetical protein BJ170DRAFT_586415 [Xylariales sp. AK1849]